MLKIDGEGRALFLLPQPDLEIPYTVPRRVKTVEVTDWPVMKSVQVPFTDGNGNQREYEVTRTFYERIPITDEEGNIIGYRDGDVIGQEGTGQYLKLWTTPLTNRITQVSDCFMLYFTSCLLMRSRRRPG